MYIIRDIVNSDYNQYMNLLKEWTNVENTITYEMFLDAIDYINNYSKIFVCLDNDKIIGIITVLIEKKLSYNISNVGHIEDVFVTETYRKKKIGSLLINKAKDFCKDKKCRKIILVCNDNIKYFYEKNGFEKRGNHMSMLLN